MRANISLGMVVLVLFCGGCIPGGDPRLSKTGFSDDFNRSDIGPHWNNTGGPYEIAHGELHIQGARNKPLWLRRTLPNNFSIEFTARSESDVGDIKVEVAGDGVSKAVSEAYTASGYVIVFGGWGNAMNIIARRDEHASDRTIGPRHPVKKSHTYAMRIERRGQTLSVWADNFKILERHDNSPLAGRGHDHFAFNNWESDLWFDNLRIKPL